MLFLPLCPLRPRQCSTAHTPQYTVICLRLKILLSFEALSGSVLKWSSLSGKNWKPFHLRGLKGSKEHQITLSVVFLLPPPHPPEACNKLHLCRARPLSGWGWGWEGGEVLPSGSDFGDPVSFKMGVCFISPPDPRPKKSRAGKTERYMIHGGSAKRHSREMRRQQTAEWAKKKRCTSW